MTEVVATTDRRMFELARQLSEANSREAEAKASRIELEEQMAEHLKFSRIEGAQTFNVSGDFGSASVVCNQPVSSKVHEDEVPAVKKAMGKKAFDSAFKVKHSISSAGLAALKKDNHDVYLVACQAVEKRPGKVSVKIKTLIVNP